MKKFLVAFIVLALAAWFFWPDTGRSWPPGVLVEQEPVQTGMPEPKSWSHNGFEFEALASYDIEARVLARERYRYDTEAKVSPVDLLLGWGRMSDQAVVEKLTFSQRGRWGFWKCRELPIPEEEINTSSANTHIIPADATVRKAVLKLRPGDVVRLRGYLVEVRADDGWKWRSSTSRTDTRGNACEVVWVEEVSLR